MKKGMKYRLITSLGILNLLKSCKFKVNVSTRFIMNNFKKRKSVLSNTNSIKGTMGLPKGRNTYGNGGFTVDKFKCRRKLAVRFYSTDVEMEECLSNDKLLIRLKKLNNVSVKYPEKTINLKLYNLLFYSELYELAYNNLKSNKGIDTPALDPDTLDGFSTDFINEIISKLKNESFKFNNVRKVDIPKPKGGIRTLGVIKPVDKLIQECIRIILNIIYEPIFFENSHGFRPHKGCHTALKEIKNDFQVVRWVSEVDVVKCFDNIPKHIIIKLLKKKISDERFINLIQKFLNSGSAYLNEAPVYSMNGIPQGSIISPILCNIILHEMDSYIINSKVNFDKGVKLQRNYKYKYLLDQGRNKEAMELCPYNLNDPLFRRLRYVRYADDFVIGFRSTRKEVVKYMDDLVYFLKENFGLIISYKIINISKNTFNFLGSRIKLSGIKNKNTSFKNKDGIIVRRRSNKRMKLYAPLINILEKLKLCGFIKGNVIVPQFKWYWCNVEQISYLYKAVFNGIANYYSFVDNWDKLASLLNNVGRQSMLKLLTAKFSAKTRNNLKKIRPEVIEQLIKISYSRPKRLFNEGKYKTLIKTLFVRYKSKARLNNLSCKICGSKHKVEMHHIRPVRTINKNSTWFESFNRRKQVPLCRICHNEVHMFN